MGKTYKLYVGIDWGNEAHQVCVIDGERRILAERSVDHTGTGIAELAAWLGELSVNEPCTVGVAIEVPRGAVVETLIERGFEVFAINPKQLDRFRDRHTVAGAKDDRRDAFVLADSLRTDQPCFRALKLDDPITIQLRELTRVDANLGVELRRLGNRLRDLLLRYFPQLLKLSPAADESWLWAVLEMAPTPEAARRLTARRLQKLLSSHHIRRLDGVELAAELGKPSLQVAPGTVEACIAHVGFLLPQLRLLHGQRKDCTDRIETLMEQLPAAQDRAGEKREHRDVDILLSFPGVGRTVAATMLAEVSQPLAERDYHSLRALTGAAPVTRQSGKRCGVVMRRACSRRLRDVIYHWARVSCMRDTHWRAHYDQLRGRGHSHARALRGVADRLLGVLVAMLQTGTLYDPSRWEASAASIVTSATS
jgi:transposase